MCFSPQYLPRLRGAPQVLGGGREARPRQPWRPRAQRLVRGGGAGVECWPRFLSPHGDRLKSASRTFFGREGLTGAGCHALAQGAAPHCAGLRPGHPGARGAGACGAGARGAGARGACRAEAVARASSPSRPLKTSPRSVTAASTWEELSWVRACSAIDTTCLVLTGRQLWPTGCSRPATA